MLCYERERKSILINRETRKSWRVSKPLAKLGEDLMLYRKCMVGGIGVLCMGENVVFMCM